MIGAANAVNYIFDDLNVTGYVNASQFNGPLAWSDLTGVPTGLDDGDDDTTYSVTGTLLDLTSTTFSVNEGTLTDTQWCRYLSGTGIQCDVSPVTDTNTQLTEEQVEDFIGAGVSGNTETRISVTYQDSDGTFDFVVDDMNDDVPESGDFGNAADLESTGALSTGVVSDNEVDYTTVTLADFTNDVGYMTDVVNDATPTLGGNLDASANDITNVNNVTFDSTASNSNVYYNGSCTIISGPSSKLVVC